MASEALAFVNHFSASILEVVFNSTVYFPGEDLRIDYLMYDRLGNVIDDGDVTTTTIILTGQEFVGAIAIDGDGYCAICDEGVWFSDVSVEDYVGSQYTVHLSMDIDDLILQPRNLTLSITGCPVGYGVDAEHNYTCNKCHENEFNVEIESVGECASCDPQINTGVDCFDGGIAVKKQYWMGIVDDSNPHHIISSECPPFLCCQSPDGCDYVEDADSLCALNRDPGSYLCSQCIDGYSESLNSPNCTKCDKSVHWEYLLLPFTIALGLLMVIMFRNRDKIIKMAPKLTTTAASNSTGIGTLQVDPVSTGNRKRRELLIEFLKECFHGDARVSLTSLVKVVVYYEQGIAQILNASTISYFGEAFAGFFDVSTHMVAEGLSSDNGNDWCFIDGLNAKWKIILDLSGQVFIVFMMTFLFVFSRFIIKTDIVLCGDRAVNFEKTFIAIFLFVVGKQLETLVKLTACRWVGTERVHFYFAYEACYGATWWISMTLLLAITASFGAVFIYARKLTPEERGNPNRFISKLSLRFRSKYWYWEFALFLRRTFIAFFAVRLSDPTSKLIFIIGTMFCIWIQWTMRPFGSVATNQAEFVLLAAFPIVVVTHSLQFVLGANVTSAMISAMTLFPIPLMIVLVSMVLHKQWKVWTKMHSQVGQSNTSQIRLRMDAVDAASPRVKARMESKHQGPLEVNSFSFNENKGMQCSIELEQQGFGESNPKTMFAVQNE